MRADDDRAEATCDGTFGAPDSERCTALVRYRCGCRRCEREGRDGGFHCCERHREQADAAHERVYCRSAVWYFMQPAEPTDEWDDNKVTTEGGL